MELDKLLEEIERQRYEMTKHGMSKGLDDKETVKISQELDKLLNQLYLLTIKRTKIG
ncbi:Spo0E family sporulation regulatory protein-aspartic acid phosphatase [Bacillus salitolerans]|uniref:Spo0E family sporulation regulatory protein-aspartic acid phosphatase n=1 Tax=Bacillus salitolerans TaxID=1437434 RepID=A0ABW4LT41_9BACI